MEEGDSPQGHPVDRIVALLREHGPMTAAALAEATGYQPGNVSLFVIRARSQGYHIWAAHQAGGTRYELREEAGR